MNPPTPPLPLHRSVGKEPELCPSDMDAPTSALPSPQLVRSNGRPEMRLASSSTIPELAARLDSLDATFASLRARVEALENRRPAADPASARVRNLRPAHFSERTDLHGAATSTPGLDVSGSARSRLHLAPGESAAELEEMGGAVGNIREDIEEVRRLESEGRPWSSEGVRKTRGRRPGTWDPSPTPPSLLRDVGAADEDEDDKTAVKKSDLHRRQAAELQDLRTQLLNPEVLPPPPTTPAHLLPFLNPTLLPSPPLQPSLVPGQAATSTNPNPYSLARARAIQSGTPLAISTRELLAHVEVGRQVGGEGGGQAGIESLGQSALEGFEKGVEESDGDSDESDMEGMGI